MRSPTRSAQTQLLSALQEGKSRLPYLSPNDWTLIIDRAKQVTFKPKEVIIQQGISSKILYLIASGKVGVTIWGTQLARLGAGEICGEMAFLEDSIPSATAIAEDEVQAYAVEWQSLMELFELFPHLASRFYRSLAVNLSRWLREQIIPKRSKT